MDARFTILVYFTFFSVTLGQDQVFTLHQNAPTIYQPATPALDNDLSFAFLNRRTFIASGVSYQQNVATADMPLIERHSGRRLGGFGFHVIQKDAGSTDLLHSLNVGVSIAYNLRLEKDHSLGFGLQSTYVDRKTSLESLTTGSQWLAAEFRFDPNADIGEPVVQNRVRYFAVNAGLNWQWKDHLSGRRKGWAGLAAFNLNEPNDSFLKRSSRIPTSYIAHAGISIFQSRRVEIIPQMYYYHSEAGGASNFLVSTMLLFENSNPYDLIHSGSVELVHQFDFQNDLSVGFVLHQPNFAIGFSYNFITGGGGAHKPFRNGTEVGIRLSRTLCKPKVSTIVIKNASIGSKRDFNFNILSTDDRIAPPVSDVDVIQKKIAEMAGVNSVRFELAKDFKFGFGKTELSHEATAYLDDLLKLLQDNPEYRLEIAGHTDNVGKPIVNYRLSEARAQAVAEYLIGRGLADSRVKYAGRGDTEPIAPNDSEQNRSKNRRVQFVIYVNR